MYDTFIKRRRHSCGLWNARRAAFSAAVALLSCTGLFAQDFPNGLYADSVDPSADSLAIAQMRIRMDEIHRTEHRPTIGLVLSGGGAKGAAHVGVFRMLEELDMPIDLICGTSMGGLMGGLYALGYKSEFIDSLLRSQDWNVALTDKVDNRYISYKTKMDRKTYLLNISFHYAEEDFSTRIIEQEKYSQSDGHLRVGVTGSDDQYGSNTLVNSLPAGYVYGFNVNNLISCHTVGYQDSINFRDLPIPFYCVASDVVSCKAKNWSSGSLKNALRSTMSIPAMFNPVRTQGMVLVDGGTRNNFPVDLARAMGADIVIGVDLSDANPTYSQVNNIGTILSQFITMLGQDTFSRNKDEADIFIKPDLHEYNMLSFSPEAISTMMQRGYDAADRHREELVQLKKFMGKSGLTLRNTPATNIADRSVMLGTIIFNGLSDEESRVLQKKCGLKAGSMVVNDDIVDAMSKLQATGAFESVTYSLLGSEAPYKLVFNCNKGPTNNVALGFRADSEELVSLIFNVGINTHKLMGSKFDFTGKVGTNSFIDARYALDLPSVPTINVGARYYSIGSRLLTKDEHGQTGADPYVTTSYSGHRERVYLSHIRWTKFDLQFGLQNRGYKVPYGSDLARYIEAKTVVDDVSDLYQADYLGGCFRSEVYTMDDPYYPSHGVKMNIDADYDFLKPGDRNYRPILKVAYDFKAVLPFGRRFAIIPDIHARAVFNDGDYSLLHSNFVGGAISGRCLEGQAVFRPLSYAYNGADKMVAASVDLRINPFKDVYVTTFGGYMRDSKTFGGLVSSLSPTIWGAGGEVAYNTIVGPIKADVHWSSLNRAFGYYISFGFDF